MKVIAVIGATAAGREIARASVAAGYRTILEDVSAVALEKAVAAILRDPGQSRRARSPLNGNGGASNLVTAASVEEAIRDADLIIETAADELEVKTELFTIFDKFAKPGAIFASTTTSIPIAYLAEITFCPERCVGMRFPAIAHPPHLEIVRGVQTSEETVAQCRDVALRMGWQVAVVRELAADGDSSNALCGGAERR